MNIKIVLIWLDEAVWICTGEWVVRILCWDYLANWLSIYIYSH